MENFRSSARVVLVVAIVAVIAFVSRFQTPTSAAGTVEYKVVSTGVSSGATAVSAAKLQALLDQIGKEGWILIQNHQCTDGEVLVFRR